MKTVKIKNSNDSAVTDQSVTEQFNVGKIICVGRNYAAHAAELGNEVPEKPVIFLKPSSSMILSGGAIKYPAYSAEMHHEVELLLLINKTIKDADEKTAEDAIYAYGVGLDMTLRDIQNALKKNGHPWTIAKCFDTSAVVSDFISKKDYRLTLNEEISLSVNGTIKQREKLNMMIFNPAQLVEYISTIMTIEEGDIIFTGTPAGVGKVEKGDKLHAEIIGVAELSAEVL